MPLFSNRSFLVKMVSDKDAPPGEPIEETIDLLKIKDHFLQYAPYYILAAGFAWNLSQRGSISVPNDGSAVNVRPIALLAKQEVSITIMQPLPTSQQRHAL
jgi:hypothetical protein